MAKLVTTIHDLMRGLDGITHTELAEKIGISRTTLYNLMKDNWQQIQRDTIEKVCEYFHCDINRLFHVEKEPFWLPFVKHGNIQIIFGSSKEFHEEKAVIGMWDIKVVNEIVSYLYELCGDKKLEPSMISSLEFHKEEEIIDFVRRHNTLIIGTPKVNHLTEIVHARLFGAIPFDSSLENRKKLPFRFIRPKEWGDSKTEGALSEISDNNLRGIYSERKGKLVAVNDWYDKFFERRIEKGRDCGMLTVVNNPFGSTENVKLIILAGYTGPSSFAMSQFLINNAKYLEPKGSRPLIRVFQATFKKPTPDKDDRTVTGMEIVDEF
jgi:DNA-binding Xre family transcriptional regulator